MTIGERRTARLLFADELRQGHVDERALAHPAVGRAVATRPPGAPRTRVGQALAVRRGALDAEHAAVEPALAARCDVLGEAAAGPPRILVRVDELPHWEALDQPQRYGTGAFRRFHDIMASAGVPYLLAVVPHPSRRPSDPRGREGRELDGDEGEELARLRADGVHLAVHGLDHRTRWRAPQLSSELLGRRRSDLTARLDRAEAILAKHGVAPEVFVPPWNRFTPRQYELLARRYAVVCGGPESVPYMGLTPTPLWRGDAVYLPSYAPFYGRAADVLGAVERLAARDAALWVAVTLHWGWELDAGWSALERLARRLAGLAVPWPRFLEAVRASR